MPGLPDLEHLAAVLVDCCADARLDPASVAVFVVDAGRPRGATPVAYLQPAGYVRPDTVLVFRAAGAEHVDRYRLRAHRLAIWRELPGIPAAALGPMLRHELEHARRFERSGPRFFEADEALRAVERRAGGEGYARLPSEREANAASAAYARRTLRSAELEALGACPECADLLAPASPFEDVVEATVAELAGLAARGAWLGDELDPSSVGSLARACRAWARSARVDLVCRRGGPVLELVTPWV
jgi:hypothetical protein